MWVCALEAGWPDQGGANAARLEDAGEGGTVEGGLGGVKLIDLVAELMGPSAGAFKFFLEKIRAVLDCACPMDPDEGNILTILRRLRTADGAHNLGNSR